MRARGNTMVAALCFAAALGIVLWFAYGLWVGTK